MALRVVLYAEGPGELGSWVDLSPAPTQPLPDERNGPAHVLIRRILSERPTGDDSEILFEAPLRTREGREARGSTLRNPAELRRLLSWPPGKAPDLAVVLVDEDGDTKRRADMQGAVAGRKYMCRAVAGVAAREFESWLIADLDAVRRVLRAPIDPVRTVEEMSPGEAKALLAKWMPVSGSDQPAEIRKQIASLVDLEVLRSRSSSFQLFYRDVRAIYSQ